MQIILLENVRNLGTFGETVDVARGYGRNFLVPTGKAVPATSANRAQFEADKAKLEANASERLGAAQARAAEISAVMLEITAKASDEGKLYGSIGTSDIAKAFKEKGLDVKRQDIRLPLGPIRELGEFEIDIQPHAEVTCTVKLTVNSDK